MVWNMLYFTTMRDIEEIGGGVPNALHTVLTHPSNLWSTVKVDLIHTKI